MTFSLLRYFVYLFLAFAFVACNSESPNSTLQEDNKPVLLPFSTGKINNLYVYLDPTYQQGPLKDTLSYYLDQPYLLTPMPSPVLDLTVYDFDRFIEGTVKTANNLIVVNVEEQSSISRFTKQQLGNEQINKALEGKQIALVRVKDVNARPQQVFYLLTKSYPNLSSPKIIEQVQDYIQTIVEESLELDNTRLASSFAKRRNLSLEDRVKDEFGLEVWVPREYQVMIEDTNMLWLLFETSELYSSLLFYKSDEFDGSELMDRALPLRQAFGTYVTTNRDNTAMVTHTNSKPLPIQREITIDEKQVIETRGLWEIDNDYLGGSFVNYTLENNRDETVTIDGFVYYSEDDVRRKMRDIDAIMSTVQIAD